MRTHGDETAYRDYRDRYRHMAKSLGFEGHMKWAEAMACRRQLKPSAARTLETLAQVRRADRGEADRVPGFGQV